MSRRFFKYLTSSNNQIGVGGLEPTNGGVKVRCLTTWLHPKIKAITNDVDSYKEYQHELGGIRTPDTVVRSHAL